MSMTQEKMYMNVDDVCAVLGVSKAFAYKIMKGYNEELKERGFLVIPGKISTEKQKSGRGISFSSRRRVLRSSLVISLSYITKIWKSACVKIPCTQNVISLI